VHLAQDMVWWWAFCQQSNSCWNSSKGGDFLVSWATISISRGILSSIVTCSWVHKLQWHKMCVGPWGACWMATWGYLNYGLYIIVSELLACTQGYLNYWPVHKGTWIIGLYTRVPELFACTQGYLNYLPVHKGTRIIGLYRKIPELWTAYKGTWIMDGCLNYWPVHNGTRIIGLYRKIPELWTYIRVLELFAKHNGTWITNCT